MGVICLFYFFWLSFKRDSRGWLGVFLLLLLFLLILDFWATSFVIMLGFLNQSIKFGFADWTTLCDRLE